MYPSPLCIPFWRHCVTLGNDIPLKVTFYFVLTLLCLHHGGQVPKLQDISSYIKEVSEGFKHTYVLTITLNCIAKFMWWTSCSELSCLLMTTYVTSQVLSIRYKRFCAAVVVVFWFGNSLGQVTSYSVLTPLCLHQDMTFRYKCQGFRT